MIHFNPIRINFVRVITTLVFLCCGSANTLFAQTAWTGGGDGVSWSDASNWDSGVPDVATDATINAVVTVTVDDPNAACNNLTLGADNAVTLQITDASNALQIAGTAAIGNDAGGQVVNLDAGPGSITIAGVVTMGNDGSYLKVSTGTLTVSSALTMDDANHHAELRDEGTLAFGGLVTHSAGEITNTTVAGTVSFNAGYNNSGGTFTTMASETITFGGDFTKSGGALTLNPTSTASFNSGTPTVTPTSAITFGNFKIESAVTVTLAGAISVAGDWTNNNGVLTPAGFTVTFEGEDGVGKYINGNTETTFSDVTFYNAAGSVLYTLDIDMTCANLNISNAYNANTINLTHGSTNPTLTVTADVNIYQPNTTTEERAWYINGGTATIGDELIFTTGNSTADNIAKVIVNSGSLTVTGETKFDGTHTEDSNQLIALTGTGSISFGNTVGTDATGQFGHGNLHVTGAGNMNFAALFDQNGGEIDVQSGGTINFNKTGDACTTDQTNTAFITDDGSFVNFAGNFTCTGGNFAFANGCTTGFTGDATSHHTGGVIDYGGIVINAGVTFTITDNIRLYNDWTNLGGTFVHGNRQVTFRGDIPVTITAASGETFYNLNVSRTGGASITGLVELADGTDLTVENRIYLNRGNINLNGQTLTHGVVGNGGDLDIRAATNYHMYGGTYKRYWTSGPIASDVLADAEGMFPMGTETGEYRPLEINSTVDATVDGVTGWFAVEHVDADKVTDLDPAQAEGLLRMSNAQFITSSSGITAGTFDLDISMTGLSTTGDAYPNADVRLAKYATPTTISVIGTHADATTATDASAPVVHRTGVTFTELSASNDFRVATADIGAAGDPLRETYYSTDAGAGDMTFDNDHPVQGTWSYSSGGSGALCSCEPGDVTDAYVVISAGHTVTVDAAATVGYLEIETGATVDDDGAAGSTMTIGVDLVTAGSGKFTPTTTGDWTVTRNVELVGTGASTTGGALNVTNDVSIGAGTSLTLGDNSTFTGDVVIDGTLAIGANTLTLDGATFQNISGSAGAATVTGSGQINFTTGHKKILSGSNLTINPELYLSSRQVRSYGTVTLINDLNGNNAGGTRWQNRPNSVLNVTGDVFAAAPNARFLVRFIPNTVNYNGGGAQSIKDPYNTDTYYNLTISNAGTKTLAASAEISNLVTIEDAAILDQAGLSLNGSAGLTMSGTAKLISDYTVAGTTAPELTGTYNLTGGTIDFESDNAQNIRSLTSAPSAYYDVILSGTASTKTLAGDVVIQNDLTISETAELDVSASNYDINIAGNWNVTSTDADPFIEQLGTVTFDGSTAQSITTVRGGGETFYDLTLSNSTGVTLVDQITAANDLTISSGAVFSAGGNAISISGDWINSGGTFTPASNIVTFAGASQSISKSSAETFYGLVLQGSATKTAGCDIVVTDDFALNGTATLDMSGSNYNLTIGGNWTVTSTSSDPFKEQNGTVTFNGSALQTITTALAAGETFYDLSVTNNITGVVLADAIEVSNDFSISNSGLFDAGGFAMDMKGDWTSNGTFTPNSNTVTFSGTGEQIITNTSGETFYNFTSNCTGPISLEAATDITVTNTLDMTAGLFNLNSRTFTLGSSGVASTLTRTGSTTTNWVYDGTFKRFWPNGTALTTANYGLFPMGTSNASSYRPFTVSTTVNTVTDGYFTVQHSDATTTTALDPVYDDGGTDIERISNAQFITTSSGITGGTYDINLTMTDLNTIGSTGDLRMVKFVSGTEASAVGTHAAATGTTDNPTVSRTGITTIADLSNDFRVSTTDDASTPLRTFYYSRTTGNWSDASSWSTAGCGGAAAASAPGVNDYVVICSGHEITVDGATSADYVVINSGGSLVGANDLNVANDLTTAGTGTFAPTGGTWTISRNVTLAGTGSSSTTGALNVTGDLNVGSGTSLTIGASSAVTGNLMVDGTLDIGTTTLTLDGTSDKTISGSAGAATINGATGTLSITTADKAIDAGTDLTITPAFAIAASTTITNNGTITLVDDLTGGNAASTWVNAANSTLNAQAAVLTTGILTATAANNTVNYSGSGAQSIKQPSSSQYNNLTCSNAGTKTFATAGTLTVNNMLTLSDAAILDASTNTLDGAGGLNMSGTADLQLARSATQPELTGAYTITGGTITLNGAGIQTIRSLSAAPSAYYNLTLANAATKSLAGDVEVQGDLTISGTAALNVTASNYIVTLAGDWNVSSANADPFEERSGTVIFDGSSAQTITTSALGTETFYDIVINNAAGVTLVDPIVVDNDLTIASSAIFDAGVSTNTITISGNWIDNGGTFTPNANLVDFNGTTQSITKSSEATFYNVNFSNSGIKSLGCNIAVHDLTIQNTAQLDVSGTNYNISLTGDWNVTSTNANPFIEQSGTVSFIGTAAQTITTALAAGETFNNFTCTNNSVGIQLIDDITVLSDLTINSGVILDANAKTINLQGNWTNSGGTFTPAAGNVNLNGTSNQSITNTSDETFYDLTINKASGTASIGANSDIIITNELTMTAGNIDLNTRTLTLGSGSVATLTYTDGIAYNGNFTRYLPAAAISSSSTPFAGLFPIGTSTSYRPVALNSTGDPSTPGYLTAVHTDANGVTDVTFTDSEADAIERIADMKTTLSASGGLAGGTYDLDVTFNNLSTDGNTADLKLETYTASIMGDVGTGAATTGTTANPTVKRTGLSLANLGNDFVVGTTDATTTPLQLYLYSRKSDDWSDDSGGNATWSYESGGSGSSCGCKPTSTDYVVISSGHTVTVDEIAAASNIIIETGATLDGTFNLTVHKDLTTEGTGVFAPTGGLWNIYENVTLAGTGNSSLSGVTDIDGNLTIGSGTTLTMNSGVGITISGNLTVDGTFALETSTATLDGNGTSISGSTGAATISTGAGGTLDITDDKTISSGSTLNIASAFSITGAQTVTNEGTITFTGNVTGSAAGSTWTNGASSTVNIGGDFLTTGTLNASAVDNTVNYNEAGAQSIKASSSDIYYNLTISTSGTKTAANALSISNNLTIQDAALLDMNTNALSGAGGLTMSGTAELLLAELSTTLPALSGAYNLTGGTIRFDGAGAQTIRSINTAAPAAYYNVDFGTSGVKTLAGNVNIQGDMEITGTAQLDATASNYDITLQGNWNVSGSNANPFLERSGTVTFNGSSAQTITTSVLGTETFYDLTINNAAGVSLVDPIVISSASGSGNTFTIESGAVFDANSLAVSLTGDWVNNGGTFTTGTGTVTFNGTGSQAITKASAETFYNITFANSGTTTLGCDLNVSNDLTIANTAALDVSSSFYAIDIDNDWNVTSTSGDPFIERSGTVTFSKDGAQNLTTVLAGGETFYNLTVSTTTTGLTLNNETNVTNLLTISSSAILLGNDQNINISSGWTNSGGTYTPGATGTVTFIGSGTQTITNTSGETFNNLTANCSGIVTLEAATDITITNTLDMTTGNFDLNSRTLTLGSGAVATLSYTDGIVYNGNFTRYFPSSAITNNSGDYIGLFPIGSSTQYRPVGVNSTVNPVTPGYLTAVHTAATGITDVSFADSEPVTIERIANMVTTLSSATLAGGTYNLDVTMSDLGTSGNTSDLRLNTYTSSTMGEVGTTAAATGSVDNPTVKRTGLAVADFANDFVVSTIDKSTTPLQEVYYSRDGGGDWNDATSWSTIACNGVAAATKPPSGAMAKICSGDVITVNVNSTIAYLDVEDGGRVNGTANLTVSKDITTAGTGYFDPTVGAWNVSENITLAGTGSSTLSGTGTIAGNLTVGAGTTLTMSGGADLNISGDVTIDGTLALGTSIATMDGASKTITSSAGTGSITGASATFNVTDNISIASSSTITIAPTFGIVGAKTLTNNGYVTLTGNLTGTAGGSTWTNAASSTLLAGGDVLTSGTLNASAVSNTVNYNKAGAQTIKQSASNTYYNLSISTSGTKTAGGAVTISNLLTVQDAAIFDMSTNALSGGGGLTMTGTSDLLLGELSTTIPALSGAYSLSGGTIRFNGAGAQTIKNLNAAAPAAYYNVDFGTSGTKSLAGETSVQGELAITGTAQLDVTASNYGINIQGNWNVSGSNANPFIERSGTVTFNGSSAQTITTSVLGTETFYNLTINNSTGVSLVDAIAVASLTGSGNALTIESGAVFDANNLAISLTGDWIDNGGTFTPGIGTVTFNGTGAQSITKGSAATFYDITFSSSGTTTLGCALNISDDLTIEGTAKLDVSASNYAIDIDGDWNVTSSTADPFVEQSGTVTFSGSGAQNQSSSLAAGETFYNLTVSTLTPGLTLNSAGGIDLNVTNLLSISSSAFLLGNDHNINLSGSWSNSGTFTPGASGTITFTGSGTHNLTNTSGETFTNLTSNTTGTIAFEAATDLTVTGTMTMTSGNFDLNSRTLTLGSGSVSTLSHTNGIVYNGNFTRYFPSAAISSSVAPKAGLFPVGSSSEYRPVEINSTVNPVTPGYLTAVHTDVAGVTDVSYADSEPVTIERIGNMYTTLSSATLAGGTYNLDVTMSDLGTGGNTSDLRLSTYTASTMGEVGTTAAATGTVDNPTVKRTGLAVADFANVFVVGTTDKATTPLQLVYYSIADGDWTNAGTWVTDGCGGVDAAASPPPSDAYVKICGTTTVTIDANSAAAYVDILDGGGLIGTGDFSVSKDFTTAGTGTFAPTGGSWVITRDVTYAGTGSYTLSGSTTINGDLNIGSGTTLTMAGGVALAVDGNVTVDGTLALGTSTATFSGAGKTIDGSAGAASISGAGATINITDDMSIASTGTLTIAPTLAIVGAKTLTNNGAVTLTGNLTGSVAGSTWTNEASSSLVAGGDVLTTGTLNASATGNTVNYNKAGAQTVKGPSSSYYDVSFSKSGTKTLGASITVDNDLLIDGTATLDVSGSNFDITLTGDWTNNGTFSGGTGDVTLNAATTQTITGTASTTFGDITFNNTFGTAPQIILEQPTIITGTATFTDGIVDAESNTLTFNAGSSTAGNTGGTSVSFVDGDVLKVGATDFVFPTGDGERWARIGISDLTGSETFTAKYSASAGPNTTTMAAAPLPVLNNVSTIENWALTRAGAEDARVTLYWEDADFSKIDDCADLRIAHYNGASWENNNDAVTTTGSCAGSGSGSITTDAVVTDFSPFAPGSGSGGNNPLPIELVKFDATIVNDAVELTWLTASETNNDFFTVERSLDAIHFEVVGVVPGAGNSSSNLSYSLTDFSPYIGSSYYRLKQTDYDGKYKYSALKTVHFDQSPTFVYNVYPNPSAGDFFNIEVMSPEEQSVLVVVYDLLGLELYSKVIVTSQNEKSISVIDPTQKLSPGIYLIVASSNNEIYKKKLIVK